MLHCLQLHEFTRNSDFLMEKTKSTQPSFHFELAQQLSTWAMPHGTMEELSRALSNRPWMATKHQRDHNSRRWDATWGGGVSFRLRGLSSWWFFPLENLRFPHSCYQGGPKSTESSEKFTEGLSLCGPCGCEVVFLVVMYFRLLTCFIVGCWWVCRGYFFLLRCLWYLKFAFPFPWFYIVSFQLLIGWPRSLDRHGQWCGLLQAPKKLLEDVASEVDVAGASWSLVPLDGPVRTHGKTEQMLALMLKCVRPCCNVARLRALCWMMSISRGLRRVAEQLLELSNKRRVSKARCGGGLAWYVCTRVSREYVWVNKLLEGNGLVVNTVKLENNLSSAPKPLHLPGIHLMASSSCSYAAGHWCFGHLVPSFALQLRQRPGEVKLVLVAGVGWATHQLWAVGLTVSGVKEPDDRDTTETLLYFILVMLLGLVSFSWSRALKGFVTTQCLSEPSPCELNDDVYRFCHAKKMPSYLWQSQFVQASSWMMQW